jgi:hypothetical protein
MGLPHADAVEKKDMVAKIVGFPYDPDSKDPTSGPY